MHPLDVQTLQIHSFELVSKIFEMADFENLESFTWILGLLVLKKESLQVLGLKSECFSQEPFQI